MIVAGIDGGSRAIKIVLLDADTRRILSSGIRSQGVDHERLAMQLLDDLLSLRSLKRADVGRIIATGYARNRIRLADSTITEITCHARGVRHLAPETMSVIEIGGQDSKLLRLDNAGRVRDFAMNDRCAAGTGRFLEMVAQRLDAGLGELGALARQSRCPAAISSTCVVFAETEIIGLLASGVDRQEIIAGVQNALASRIAAMAGGPLAAPILFTGGVALIDGMRQALERALEQPVLLCPQPQLTGALGAALLAGEQCQQA